MIIGLSQLLDGRRNSFKPFKSFNRLRSVQTVIRITAVRNQPSKRRSGARRSFVDTIDVGSLGIRQDRQKLGSKAHRSPPRVLRVEA
jgi:hypothetical protein